MKFKDYKEAQKRIREAESEFYKQARPYAAEEEALRTAIQREWTVGCIRFPDTGKPRADEILVASFSGTHLRLEVHEAHRTFGYPIDSGGGNLCVSSIQWRIVADIVACIEAWQEGKRDALPPSGPWPGAGA